MKHFSRPRRIALMLASLSSAGFGAPSGDYTFDESQAFLNKYCYACHQDKGAAGGFKVSRVHAHDSLGTDAQRWITLAARVKNGEMPPKGAPAPALEVREQFSSWVDRAVHTEVCSGALQAGPAPVRRLNRDEYAATIQDLLDLHVDLSRLLPADGAGGEGFDNAAETLFLSPLLTEKYLEAAKFAMDSAAKEYKSRTKILIAKPGPTVTPLKAARTIFENFLPRAFRRPVTEADIAPYLSLFTAASKQGMTFEESVFFCLRASLVSPMFLFRTEPPNTSAEAKPVDQYAMASRLSYFLWGSMPDELLFDVAAAGKLHDPAVLRELIGRMLRNDRSMVFAQRFTEQWLRTRELSGDKAPDAKAFPAYAADEELRGDLRFEPIMFFREVLLRNLPLTNFLDSKYAISSRKLDQHYGITTPLEKNSRSQPQWVELPADSHRGGLLGMGAVLSASSFPYRTSPVLRGAWILDSVLGTPPPPPPANVPPLDDVHGGAAAPKTVRQRLEQHRANPSCASCHSRIDAWGFALENYDAIGRWRTEDAGQALDVSGALLDGTTFQGPVELRQALMERKDLFVRNLTSKMLGYALGRGLTLKDSCTVDAIVAKLKQSDYRAQTLLEEIVLSVPFQYQAGAPVKVTKGVQP